MNGSAYLPGQEVAVFSNSRKGWIAAHVTAVHRDGSVTCKCHGLPKQKDIPLAMQTPNSIMLVQDSSVTPVPSPSADEVPKEQPTPEASPDGSALKLRTLFEQIADEMKRPIEGFPVDYARSIILHHVTALRAVAQHLQPSAAEQLLRELEENARSRGEADFQRRALKEIVEGVITGTVQMGSSYFGLNLMELGPLGQRQSEAR